MTLRLAVLASGRGSNLDSILEKSASGLLDAQVTLVATDKVGAPCMAKARQAGVPATIELPPEPGESRIDYDARLASALAAEGPDLIVLAGFMRLLSPSLCAAFKGRIINIHPALLPRHKGAHGIRDTLAAGDSRAGCTTHFVTAELDGGPLVLQASLPVRDVDDEASLAARVLRLEHQILPRTVQLIAEGRVHLEHGKVRIEDGSSWQGRVPMVEDAQYPDAF